MVSLFPCGATEKQPGRERRARGRAREKKRDEKKKKGKKKILSWKNPVAWTEAAAGKSQTD